MSLSLPGYYYDEVKKKYFKIEKSHSAPASAAWSAANVKRRKTEAQHAAVKHARAEKTKRHVKRARVLREPLLGGFLDRQLGIGAPDADVPAATWAAGLVYQYEVAFIHDLTRKRAPNLDCFWIGGQDERTGLGVAYTSLNGSRVHSRYICTDEIGMVTRRDSRYFQSDTVYQEPGDCNQISSISYHAPSHRMLVTSREPCADPGVHFFSPRVTSSLEDKPLWELGAHSQTTAYSSVHLMPGRRFYSVNLATPAPAASPDLVCTLATNDGIIRLSSNDDIGWITPRPEHTQQKTAPMDVLAQSFHATNPSVLYAGSRSSNIHTLDLRIPSGSWTSFQTASAVTHLRSLESNPNYLLVAALRSTLHVYDLRFLAAKQGTQTPLQAPPSRKRNRNQRQTQPPLPAATPPTATPVLTFPEYRNEAHIHMGLDVNQDAGIVAAAHDDNSVALYSLHSGLRMRTPGMAREGSRAPVKSLMFQKMPRERHASLWVGDAAAVKKFSVGVRREDDEW